MSMTAEAKRWHEQYEHAEPIIREAVEEAYKAARAVFASRGFDTASDDTAENLVSALMAYLTDSAT